MVVALDIRDETLRINIGLAQLENAEVQQILALLDEADDDLVLQITKAIERSASEPAIRRLRTIRNELAAVNAEAYRTVGKRLTDDLREISERTSARYLQMLESTTAPIQHSFRRPSRQLLQAIVSSQPFQGALLKDQVAKLAGDRLDEVTRAIEIGLAQNESLSQFLQRLRGTQKAGYTDGILHGAPRRHLTSVVRTATQHVTESAREQLYRENDDLLVGRMWVSTLDHRTCPICQLRDGKVWSYDSESQIYTPEGHNIEWGAGPGRIHWQCRCTAIPVLGNLQELQRAGIDVGSLTKGQRAAFQKPVAASTNYPDWIRNQSYEIQYAALGSHARVKALRSGKSLQQVWAQRFVPTLAPPARIADVLPFPAERISEIETDLQTINTPADLAELQKLDPSKAAAITEKLEADATKQAGLLPGDIPVLRQFVQGAPDGSFKKKALEARLAASQEKADAILTEWGKKPGFIPQSVLEDLAKVDSVTAAQLRTAGQKGAKDLFDTAYKDLPLPKLQALKVDPDSALGKLVVARRIELDDRVARLATKPPAQIGSKDVQFLQANAPEALEKLESQALKVANTALEASVGDMNALTSLFDSGSLLGRAARQVYEDLPAPLKNALLNDPGMVAWSDWESLSGLAAKANPSSPVHSLVAAVRAPILAAADAQTATIFKNDAWPTILLEGFQQSSSAVHRLSAQQGIKRLSNTIDAVDPKTVPAIRLEQVHSLDSALGTKLGDRITKAANQAVDAAKSKEALESLLTGIGPEDATAYGGLVTKKASVKLKQLADEAKKAAAATKATEAPKPSLPTAAAEELPKAPPDPVIGSKKIRAQGVKTLEGDEWREVGTKPGGSLPGAIYEDGTGDRWLVKFPKSATAAGQVPQQMVEEVLANRFYRAAGVPVPEVHLVTVNGRTGIASKFIDGAEKRTGAALGKLKSVRSGFVMDAWLANWDVVGASFDNILVRKGGAAYRIDVGGALRFRAQGSAKGGLFGAEVGELQSLRNASMNSTAAKTFGSITNDEVIAQIRALEERFSDAAIRRLVRSVKAQGLADPNGLVQTLIARRNYLSNVRRQLEAPKSPALKLFDEAFEARNNSSTAAAFWNRKASAQSSRGWIGSLSTSERSATAGYSDGTYRGMNAWLRNTQGTVPLKSGSEAEALEAALKKSSMPQDMVLWRGTTRDWVPASVQVGAVLTDHGFVSTSLMTSTASGFSRGVMLKILVRGGKSGAAYIKPISHFSSEWEVVLQRGSRFRVIEVGTDSRGRRLITVEWLGGVP